MDQADWIFEEIVGENVFALFDGVIENNTQSCNAAKRVDAAQACRGRGGIGHP